MSIWTVNGSTFAELGLGNLSRRLVNQAEDEVTFDAPGTAYDADPLFDYGDTITIAKDGTRWFVGRIISNPRQATVQEERISYRVVGPWWYLTKIVYQQDWLMWDEEEEGVLAQKKSRVIIGQNAAGERITSGEQIADVLEYARSRGAPFMVGVIDPAVQVPWSEECDLKCSEVIVRLLQYSPDCVCSWNYATPKPQFLCRSRANMAAASAAVVGSTCAACIVTPRYDLQIPGVVINYEQTHEADGVAYESVTQDTAGEVEEIETLASTIELAGSRLSRLSQKTLTEEFPADLKDLAWWQEQIPALNDLDGLEVVSATRSLEAQDYPRILVEGTIQPWMQSATDPDNPDAGVVAKNDDLTLVISCYESDAVGNSKQGTKSFTVTVRATNAEKGEHTYHQLESFVSGEPVPVGLAAAIYDAWSELQYDGHLVFDEGEVVGTIVPGKVLNLTGGHAEWASMRAVVQQTLEDVDNGLTTVTFGPAKHLSPADLVSLLRAIRTRKISAGWALRSTGESSKRSDTVLQGGKGPVHDAVGGGDLPKKIVVAQIVEGKTQKIQLDPYQISKVDEDVDMCARELIVYGDGDSVRKRQILCSEEYEVTEGEEAGPQTFITAIRYYPGTKQFQVKTRRGYLVGPVEDETDWALMDGGQAEECDT